MALNGIFIVLFFSFIYENREKSANFFFFDNTKIRLCKRMVT